MTQVQSLDQEDPLEKEMATHSSILAWKISWTEEPGGLQSMGLIRDQNRVSCIGRQVLYHMATREAQRKFFFFLVRNFS